MGKTRAEGRSYVLMSPAPYLVAPLSEHCRSQALIERSHAFLPSHNRRRLKHVPVLAPSHLLRVQQRVELRLHVDLAYLRRRYHQDGLRYAGPEARQKHQSYQTEDGEYSSIGEGVWLLSRRRFQKAVQKTTSE